MEDIPEKTKPRKEIIKEKERGKEKEEGVRTGKEEGVIPQLEKE